MLSPPKHAQPTVNCAICRCATTLQLTAVLFHLGKNTPLYTPLIYFMGMSIFITSSGAKEFV